MYLGILSIISKRSGGVTLDETMKCLYHVYHVTLRMSFIWTGEDSRIVITNRIIDSNCVYI